MTAAKPAHPTQLRRVIPPARDPELVFETGEDSLAMIALVALSPGAGVSILSFSLV